MISKYSAHLLFFILLANTFLGWSFQILNISGIPLNYLFLIFFLIFQKWKPIINILNEINISNIFIYFVLYLTIKLFFGFFYFGLIALRDATFFLDIFFIIITINLYKHKEHFILLKKFLNLTFYLTLIFCVCWFFKDQLLSFSPILTSPTGMQTSLIFNFSTIAFLSTWFSFYLLSVKNDRTYNYFIFIFLLSFSLLIFQRRFLYIGLINLFFFSLFINKKKTIRVFKYFLILAIILPIANFFDLSITGKIGEADNIIFFVNHLLSTIPGYNFENEDFLTSQETANQRIEWWTFVFEKQFSQLKSIFFGLGFGKPLIDFVGYQNIPIREPHNSYITIFARIGFFGFIIYSILMLKIFKLIYNLFLFLKNKNMSEEIKYFFFFSNIYSVCIFNGNS